jgi:soluble lytic murein transglycosylase-like protein
MTIAEHIHTVALAHQLPRGLVHAICHVESSMNPFAIRYEPSFKWLAGDQGHMSPTERIGQMMSWGPMQVMGAVAREHGFAGWFPELCTLPTGILYGCLHLARFKAKYDVWLDVIAAYNAGSPRRAPDGRYANQSYVDKVLHVWQTLQPILPTTVSEV